MVLANSLLTENAVGMEQTYTSCLLKGNRWATAIDLVMLVPFSTGRTAAGGVTTGRKR